MQLQLCYAPLLFPAPLQQTVFLRLRLLLVVVCPIAPGVVSAQRKCCWRWLRAHHERRRTSQRCPAAGINLDHMDLFACLGFGSHLESTIPCWMQQQAVADLAQDIIEVDGNRPLCHQEKNVACYQQAVSRDWMTG
jgi:hypothetical protein